MTYGKLKKLQNLEIIKTSYLPGFVPIEKNEDNYKAHIVSQNEKEIFYNVCFPPPGINGFYIAQI